MTKVTGRSFVGGPLATASGLGAELPSEILTYPDAETGRRVKQFTSVAANSYPLYYFTPSHTTDGRYCIIHSERSGYFKMGLSRNVMPEPMTLYVDEYRKKLLIGPWNKAQSSCIRF